jgi:hypothetical protein
VQAGIEGLRRVFEEKYRFQVQEYKIPSSKPLWSVESRILKFLEVDGMDTLLVVYYAGHARRGMEGANWFPYVETVQVGGKNACISTPHILPSVHAQQLLVGAKADVLLLYDCCHPGSIPTYDLGGRTECIAACEFGEFPLEFGEHPFTKALTSILTVASTQSYLSVGELHSRVLRELKCLSAPPARDADGSHTDHLERQPSKTPIYCMAGTKPRPSIVLGPLSSVTQQLSIHDGSRPESLSAGSANLAPSTRKGESLSNHVKALVTMRVRHAPSKQEWIDWIRGLPSGVYVYAHWESFSSYLLQVQMPVSVWDLLRKSPGYDFSGLVTSDNLGPYCKP